MRDFHRLLAAQTVSLLGDLIAAFAVQAAVVFRMHGSARDAAGVFLMALIPTAVLGPVAGVLADRWDPRRTMIVSDLARAVLVALLAFATSIPQLYAISFAVSCCSAFFSPARTVAMPGMVNRGRLMEANARMQQAAQFVRVASPAAAGALVAWGGETACYFADSASFAISAALIATVSRAKRQDVADARNAGGFAGRRADIRRTLTGLCEGARFLRTDSTFRFLAITMNAGAFATGCFGALAPVYVRDVLRAAPTVYAAIGACIATGSLLGALVVRGVAAVPLLRAGVVTIGLSILPMAVTANCSAAMAGSFGIGLGAAWVTVATAALLQGHTPSGMRGRASSALASLMAMAQAAALICAGAGAARIGIAGVFAMSATVLIAAGLRRASQLHEIDGETLRQHAA